MFKADFDAMNAAYAEVMGSHLPARTVFAVGAFASLGLPGLSGFIAEFQIFTGSIAAAPVTQSRSVDMSTAASARSRLRCNTSTSISPRCR